MVVVVVVVVVVVITNKIKAQHILLGYAHRLDIEEVDIITKRVSICWEHWKELIYDDDDDNDNDDDNVDDDDDDDDNVDVDDDNT